MVRVAKVIMIRRLIFTIGSKLRNPSYSSYLKNFKNSRDYSLVEKEYEQFKRCKELLIFAYNYSPYWKKICDTNHFNPYSFTNVRELTSLPILDKSDLLLNKDSIQSLYSFKKTFYTSTSGSTGTRLEFLRNEEWDSFNRARLAFYYSWYNVHPWESCLYVWGFSFDFIQQLRMRTLDFLVGRYRVFHINEKNQRKIYNRLKEVSYIEGYSSVVYELSNFINNVKLKGHRLKMIKCTSETLKPIYQESITKSFWF